MGLYSLRALRLPATAVLFCGFAAAQTGVPPISCNRTIVANVVALDQPIMVNRLGSEIPGGMIYALARDVVDNTVSPPASCDSGAPHCKPGQVGLREQKRPRPIVLRMGIGDCLTVNFTNLIQPDPDVTPDNYQVYQNPKIGQLWGQTVNRSVGFHPAGLELLNIPPVTPLPPVPAGPCNPSMKSDAFFVGTNCTSLAAPGQTISYQFYAREEGHFIVYSNDDAFATDDRSGQQEAGLFGSVTVEPANAEFFRSQVTQTDLQAATYVACLNTPVPNCVGPAFSNPPQGNPVKLTPQMDASGKTQRKEAGKLLWTLTTQNKAGGNQTQWDSTVTVGEGNRIDSLDGHPILNYYTAYQAGNNAGQPVGTPVLSMLRPAGTTGQFELVHSDLTAIVTGPGAGRFPDYQDSPLFGQNPALPDRREPFREFTIIYHVSEAVVQPFPAFNEGPLKNVLGAGADGFAINYGIGGIGPEVLSNRLKVGPSKDCVECKFEEFFLSSWVLGDPAMVVDKPTGGNQQVPAPGQLSREYEPSREGAVKSFLQGTHELDSSTKPSVPAIERSLNTAVVMPEDETMGATQAVPPTNAATKAFYPDDPSNVYHSYMRDHVKFRISNVSIGQPHVHHQHAHQWLQSPDSDDSQYLDSQMIIPGSSYTLEMAYNGSGNRNQTVGDSIFHCHFYPHFAAGMWSLWRVHDVFEAGTTLNKDGSVATNVEWNRALPDGEIVTGTPIPAVVPLPTLGMAPIPALVKLVDHGTRAVVKPDGQEMGNPGYPFFVPGVAGHRAPHPPMDFAVDEQNTTASSGTRYLDGGLPRHLILDGKIVREFHTRWDFTKETVAFDDPSDKNKATAGGLFAFILPENGTDVERAAMRAHSRRTYETAEPDGQQGSFILNGLPPASGAPYARPDIDDNGNAVTNRRRYQAAVIQTDVVLNKDGWHYPQQRMLTLWNDVAPTVSGARPPEPLFFRANSGDTVEFWHTNLVPGYYELDDFQVRTPTDIIGQHIHLVKFDVLASDGAANGFNYEDGTFSPDEVRSRIAAMNLMGGLHTGVKTPSGDYPAVEACLKSAGPLAACLRRVAPISPPLKPTPPPAVFGPAPEGQSWLGAQTTIQLWQVDPLLNNRGRDRTVRTVFTHDHFGPSTHQNVGLYAGLLAEPPGSTWIDPLTNKPLYDLTSGRTDGGPTSWQANIVAKNPQESYREFALEFQDLQLAYLATSSAQPHLPLTTGGSDAPLFAKTFLDQKAFDADVARLKAGTVPPSLNRVFGNNGIVMSNSAKAAACSSKYPFTWCLTDGNFPGYTLGLNQDPSHLTFTAFTPDLPPGWANPASALGPPAPDPFPGNQNAPFPLLIDSSPGIGTFSLNYRNEPVPLRVTQTLPNGKPPANPPPAQATDLAWALASLNNRVDTKMNTQPETACAAPPCPIDPAQPSGFKFPASPLLGASNPMTGPDPYTPMLRAYENDRIQIRTLVGAHVSTHPFMVHGVNWLYEPDYGNSGYKSLQGMGLSEHFELLFNAPAPVKTPGATFSDYLYAPNSGVSGFTQGMWGLLRTYDGSTGLLPNLAPLPNNPKGSAPQAVIGTCPEEENKNPVTYTVVAGTPATFGLSQVEYNTRSGGLTASQGLLYVNKEDLDANGHLNTSVTNIEPLILRVNAGRCVSVELQNQIPQGTTPTENSLSAPFGSTVPVTISPTATAGLHAPELTYNVNGSDGTNVGYNQLQTPGKLALPLPGTAGPGGSVVMKWYAGNISMVDGKAVTVPIEFGSVPLLPADPLYQASNGLVGALLVEPAGAKWQTDPGTRASATVTPLHGEPFREFVVVLQNGLAGVTGTNVVSYSATGGVNYRSEPQALRMPPSGGSSQAFTQGVAADAKVLDEASLVASSGVLGKSPLLNEFQKMKPPFTLIPSATASNLSGTWSITGGTSGTCSVAYQAPQSAGGLAPAVGPMVQVTGCVANAVSLSLTPGLLEALDGLAPLSGVQAVFAAAGITLGSGAASSLAGPRGWTINDGIYTFTVCAGSFSPGGTGCVTGQSSIQLLQISYAIYSKVNAPLFPHFDQFVSDTLNKQDPQTPIFCAQAGQPVRFRVVQPGADTDQMVEIHGHSWQQEPYIHNGLEIGHNPESQQMGTQVISANDKLDLVLPSAGGSAAIPGDYLYHAFMAQVQGMWGLFRVLPAGTDPVQACHTQPGYFIH